MAKKQTQTEGTALATVERRVDPALAVYEGADRNDVRGKEGITREDMTIPRLAICQSLSPQRKKSDPAYIEGIEEGDLFNTLTGENYGPGPINLVILGVTKGAAVLDEQGKVLEHGVDWNDSRCEFTDDGKGNRVKPIATRFYDFMAILEDTFLPIVIRMKRTQMPVARNLNSLINFRPGASWAGKYAIRSVEEKKEFVYFNFKVTPAGAPSAELVAVAEEFYTRLTTGQVKVTVDASSDETAAHSDEVPF